MRILVTGATGFLGRALCSTLAERRYDLVCLGRRPSEFGQHIEWDLRSRLPEDRDLSCDIIVHLGAAADFSDGFNADIYETNTIGTLRLCALSAREGAVFVFASMAGVHGNSGMVGLDSPLSPENHYSLGKLIAERIVQESTSYHAILRIGGIYGVGGPAHLSLNRSISEAALRSAPPQLVGSGLARRNYVSVIDAARWIAALVDAYGEDDLRPERQLIYLAGSETLTIRQYLETISEVLLDGAEISEEAGPESADFLVAIDEPPIPMTTFRDYLRGLHE